MKKILSFPITRIESFEYLTEREAFYQLRLQAIERVNEVNAGIRPFTKGNIEALTFLNSICGEYGFEPIDFGDPCYINVQEMGYLSEE